LPSGMDWITRNFKAVMDKAIFLHEHVKAYSDETQLLIFTPFCLVNSDMEQWQQIIPQDTTTLPNTPTSGKK
jgi:hypothetical protein